MQSDIKTANAWLMFAEGIAAICFGVVVGLWAHTRLILERGLLPLE